MADFNALEALINAYIKQNGVKAITGNILNGVLRGMVSALGKGWTIADGDATPTTDPGTMTGPVAYIAHTAGTYEHFGNLVVNEGEVALLKYNEQTWTKEVIASLAATASVDGNVGTPAVDVSFQNGVLSFDFRNMKGNPGVDGAAAGFGTVNATVDANIGTPGVSVQTSGPDTAKNMTFAFTNLKGETGVTSVVATVDNTVGTPSCAVSLVGQELHLDFTGLKGPQGDTGSSVDYPFTIVNNLTTNDATQALSAAMGVQLESEISQLDLKVKEFVPGVSKNLFDKTSELIGGYVNTSGGIQPSSGDTYLTKKIELKTNTDYVIGFTTAHSSFASLYIAAFDSSNNKIPITIGGTDKTYYTYGTNQKTAFRVNDAGTTCYVAFTVKFSTQDARNYLMLMEGNELPSVYAPYNLIIPKGKYDASGFVSSADLQKVEDKIDDVETDNLVEKKEDATISSSAYMQTNGVPVAASGWEYLTLSVSAGQKYTVSAVAGLAARLWLVYDSSNNQLGLSSDSSAVAVKTETIVIPEGGAVLYVNARLQSADAVPTIKLHEKVVDAEKVYVGTENIVDYINRILSGGKNYASLKFTPGQDSFIISPFNETHNIKAIFTLSRQSSQSGNPCFNFSSVYLVNKTTGVESIVHACGDDITPAQFNNTYIGANHADSDMRQIVCTGHGKTYEDIGSVWQSSGGSKFNIVAVIDENTLWMLSNNSATYPKFRFSGPGVDTGTLTHYSGATHTGNISIESSSVAQFYSALRVASLSVLIDGKEVTEDGEYSFSHLDICENYDVLNPASVLDLIKQGVGTFTENPNPNSFTQADKVTRHSIVYGFDSAGEWRISTNFVVYQDINLSYFGFTQMGVISGSNRKMYIPKALPIDGKDFRQIEDFTSLSSALNFTSEYWENPLLPPDRWLAISDSIGVHSGYLFDYGIGGEHRKDYVNNALILYTTLKTYPIGINSKITANGGDVFSAVVWRSYLDRAKINTGGIIATNAVEYAGKCYIYADFNAVGTYEIDIPGKYVGRELSVFEKSDNVTVLSQLANGKLLVRVTSATPMYGYLVAKIN